MLANKFSFNFKMIADDCERLRQIADFASITKAVTDGLANSKVLLASTKTRWSARAWLLSR